GDRCGGRHVHRTHPAAGSCAGAAKDLSQPGSATIGTGAVAASGSACELGRVLIKPGGVTYRSRCPPCSSSEAVAAKQRNDAMGQEATGPLHSTNSSAVTSRDG